LRTAVDTNILSGLLSREPLTQSIVERLGEARERGSIVIAGIVYAELLAYPNATEPYIREFLDVTGIQIDGSSEEALWHLTGQRFARYAHRRRGGAAKRMLADFIVGAHALLHADQLMTLDATRYERDFPDLKLDVPGR
jgi:predicted nucleic acid-binding protein